MTFRQRNHLFLGKPIARSQIAWSNHGIFAKVIQCRLCVISLYWQNACEIRSCKNYIRARAFEETAKQVNIRRDDIVIHTQFAQDGIPLVYYHKETLACALADAIENLHQIIVVLSFNLREFCKNFVNNLILDNLHNFLLVPESCGKVSHIDAYHIILVEMCLKRNALLCLQSSKQLTRIARLVVIST